MSFSWKRYVLLFGVLVNISTNRPKEHLQFAWVA